MPYPMSAVRGRSISDNWQDVAIPDAAFSWVPFTAQLRGSTFRPDPSFDLQTYANITVNKTYYVDSVNGNDGNTGADWDHALRTMNVAYAKGDVDRVYVRDSYFFRNECMAESSRNVETIGIGTVILSSNIRNVAGAFSKIDNHYVSTFPTYQYMASAKDETRLDIYGIARNLSAKANIATVDATPNSFFYDYNGVEGPRYVLYIRLNDDREPDDSVRYHDSGPVFIDTDNKSYYWENITFQHGLRLRNSTATAGSLYCLKNCKMYAMTLNAADVILQDCVLEKGQYAGGDGVNFNVRDGVITRLIEIDCTNKHAPAGGGSDQCSTGHAACESVRLNPNYFDWGGQIIADVTGCQSWVLGGKLYQSATGVAYYQDGDAWLDRCYLDGHLQEGGSGTIHIRNCTITGNQSGDIQSY